jgi:O-antigen ligase
MITTFSGHRTLAESKTDFRSARILYYLGMAFVAAGAIRPFGGLNVSDWLFFASLATAAFTVVFSGVKVDPSVPRLLVFGFAVFSLGAVFSLPVAVHPLESFGAYGRFTFTVLVWFALGAVVLRDRRHVEIAVAAWILSVAISGLAALAQVIWGPLLFASFTTATTPQGGFAGRQIGLSGHPNDLGAAAAIVIGPGILFAASRLWTRTKRYLFVAMLCLVLVCIALSASVSAFLAGLASAGMAAVSGRVGIKRLAVIVATLSLTAIALAFISQQGSTSVLSPVDRLSSTFSPELTPQATGLYRLNLDALAWNEIVGSPFFGVGLDGDTVAQVLGGPFSVHNMFLFVWVGAGIFGFLGLLIITASLAASYLEEFRRSTAPAERTLVFALGTAFLSFLMITMVEPVLYVRYGWVPAALLMALRAQRLRSEKVERERRTPYRRLRS